MILKIILLIYNILLCLFAMKERKGSADLIIFILAILTIIYLLGD